MVAHQGDRSVTCCEKRSRRRDRGVRRRRRRRPCCRNRGRRYPRRRHFSGPFSCGRWGSRGRRHRRRHGHEEVLVPEVAVEGVVEGQYRRPSVDLVARWDL